MNNGAGPIKLDRRDLSYHGTYRSYGAAMKPMLPPSFTVDEGRVMWDQNMADPPAFNVPFPFGCTGFTVADIFTDVYDSICKPEYTYRLTCEHEGHPPDRGCQVRNAMLMTQVYGLQFLSENTQEEAQQHRGGKYFNIRDDGKMDWYSGITTSIYEQRVGANLCSPWFPSWNLISADGILSMPTEAELKGVKADPFSYSWHNYKCSGWKDGKLEIKSHQGRSYGDKGFCYMPKDVANVVFELYGSGAFIQPKYTPRDLFTIKLAILEVILVKIRNFFGGSNFN